MAKECPIHGPMRMARTQWGGLYVCVKDYCTVRCWDGPTSTPADKQTREARIAAHNAFDAIWKQRQMRRGTAYTKLAKFLGIPKSKCHIGMFDKATCERVLEFVVEVMSKR